MGTWVVYDSLGTALVYDIDGTGGLPVYDTASTLLSLTVTEA